MRAKAEAITNEMIVELVAGGKLEEAMALTKAKGSHIEACMRMGRWMREKVGAEEGAAMKISLPVPQRPVPTPTTHLPRRKGVSARALVFCDLREVVLPNNEGIQCFGDRGGRSLYFASQFTRTQIQPNTPIILFIGRLECGDVPSLVQNVVKFLVAATKKAGSSKVFVVGLPVEGMEEVAAAVSTAKGIYVPPGEEKGLKWSRGATRRLIHKCFSYL
jgi:hypothetical protein